MVAAMAERTETTAERRRSVPCAHCGGFLCEFGVRGDLPPGLVWTRLRCPNRRCAAWTVIDAATGLPLAGLNRVRSITEGTLNE
jgi:hypothetical protein